MAASAAEILAAVPERMARAGTARLAVGLPEQAAEGAAGCAAIGVTDFSRGLSYVRRLGISRRFIGEMVRLTGSERAAAVALGSAAFHFGAAAGDAVFAAGAPSRNHRDRARAGVAAAAPVASSADPAWILGQLTGARQAALAGAESLHDHTVRVLDAVIDSPAGTAIPARLWVDEQGLLRRARLPIPGSERDQGLYFDVEFSDYGIAFPIAYLSPDAVRRDPRHALRSVASAKLLNAAGALLNSWQPRRSRVSVRELALRALGIFVLGEVRAWLRRRQHRRWDY